MKGIHYLIRTSAVVMALAIFHPANAQQATLGKGYDFKGNGKRDFPCELATYHSTQLPDTPLILAEWKWQLDKALDRQIDRLKKKRGKPFKRDDLTITHKQLIAASNALKQVNEGEPLSLLHTRFNVKLLAGEDGCSNMHFTGYYTPVLQVSREPRDDFQFPLYRRPMRWPQTGAPTREAIDEKGALKGQSLEIAYTKSQLDNYFLHVQGSGYAEFVDSGERQTLQFGGKNGKPYTSIGRYLVDSGAIPANDISLQSIRRYFKKYPKQLQSVLNKNESYTFFTLMNDGPFGALNTAVVPGISIAVDPKYIPLGSIILAEIPILDLAGKVEDYQYRILLAQDKGAAIKGIGHVDLYLGAGEEAQHLAGQLHHYGRAWLLAPK